MPKTSSTKVERACQICQKQFLAFPSNLKRGSGKYCSKQCYWVSIRSDPVESFMSFVNKTESCWIWMGAKAFGYGKFNYSLGSGKMTQVAAHRFSWEIHCGPIPDGLYVCHNCPGGDNRACVNPAHLWLGTHDQNMQDMVNKRAARHGVNQHMAKLTDDAVREIRTRYATGMVSQEKLAREFGVTQGAIWLIVRHKAWKHVTP